ncbi:MAG TPA: hypothetical protein VL360_00875 [Gammaproteobacteria bacterium]|jgi:hypothetical protein|nr:hypothetical protein [Gammaproteobacteria bacterium]
MLDDANVRPKLVMFFYITQVIVNWMYIFWVQTLPGFIINAWFVVLPLIGYFYFTFAAIATIGLWYRIQSAFILAICVLMFGITADVISYGLIYKIHFLLEHLLLPLLAVNACVIFYMIYNQSYFKGK